MRELAPQAIQFEALAVRGFTGVSGVVGAARGADDEVVAFSAGDTDEEIAWEAPAEARGVETSSAARRASMRSRRARMGASSSIGVVC